MEKQAQFTNKKVIFNKNADFPELPGVYKFFNSKLELIYIGKAKNIKNRVKSYLNVRNGEGKRKAKLKYRNNSFDIIEKGDFVICAISGKKIPLEKLNYWNVDRQEAYFSAIEADIRFKKSKKKL